MIHDALLDELRQMRLRLDQIAAAIVGDKTAKELWQAWSCGHKHQTRGEAMRCKQAIITPNALEAFKSELG